jgi:hypothetical protein
MGKVVIRLVATSTESLTIFKVLPVPAKLDKITLTLPITPCIILKDLTVVLSPLW